MKSLKIILSTLVMLAIVGSPAMGQEMGSKGYAVGLHLGYPVVAGDYYKDVTGPVLGLVVGTPFGFMAGPLSVGVGGVVGITTFKEDKNAAGAFVTLSSVVYELANGPVAITGGAGYLGGLGVSGSVSWSYSLPNMPVMISPTVGAVVLTGVEEDTNSGWIGVGVAVTYQLPM